MAQTIRLEFEVGLTDNIKANKYIKLYYPYYTAEWILIVFGASL